MIKEIIDIAPGENNIYIKPADIDGFKICEQEGKGEVYIYYSEIELLEQAIRKVKYERDNNIGIEKHSPGSQKSTPDYANNIYKGFGGTKDFKEYNKYINSNSWKEKRDLRVKHDGKCRNCGSKIGLQVHHKHYSSLGKEDVESDLVTLCDECHEKITRQNRRKRRGVVTDFS